MNVNGVENQCFVVLNIKLHVKITFKTFYWLLELLYAAFIVTTTTKMAFFARNFSVC